MTGPGTAPAQGSAPGSASAQGSAPGAVSVRPGSIGILGGTFDPFHLGHLALARAARDQLGLERVLVIPAGVPPHKQDRPISRAEVRLELVEAGIAGEPRLEASRMELDRAGPSWTVDTVAALADSERAAGREPDLTLILSAETFAGLPEWHDPERLLDLARIAVGPRSGRSVPARHEIAAAFPGRADRIVEIDGPRLEVSASNIRRRAALGQSLDALVPPAVAKAIADDRLYGDHHLLEDEPTVTDPAPLTGTPAANSAANATATRVEGRPGREDGLPSRDAVATAAAAHPDEERPPLDIARRIVELAEDKKAADIILLDLVGLTTFADAFVICSGGSERQLDAIADGVIEGMRAEKVRPIGREGTAASHWVLVDFGAVVVHVFTPPEREYYSLEKHWGEAKTILRLQ